MKEHVVSTFGALGMCMCRIYVVYIILCMYVRI